MVTIIAVDAMKSLVMLLACFMTAEMINPLHVCKNKIKDKPISTSAILRYCIFGR